jgi:predicted ATPase/DNA-binding SARP family transcriptional activator
MREWDAMGPPEYRGVRRSKVLRIRLLGGFSVSVESRTIAQNDWHLRKAATLVKLLALAPGHRMHREQTMELLWPDSSRRMASNSLRSTLHAARRVLDPDAGSLYLASEDASLVLCPEGNLWVDVEAFEEVAATARREKEPATYQGAIELYSGELLPEDRYEEWAQGRREELRQLYLALIVELADLYKERGEHRLAVEALQKAVAEEPILEEAHTGLMGLYVLSGRPEQALTQYERLRELLSERLGREPTTATRRLHDEIAAGRIPSTGRDGPAPEEPPHDDKHNLPAPSSNFVGREREMLEVKRLLAMTRLLTLTGAGGSSKTRLALEVAGDLVGVYPDGVWLVELAPVSEGTLVPQVVVNALRVRELPGRPITDTLVGALRTRRMLLLLDICEHLIDACANLADTLLGSCRHLKIFATSREPLGVRGGAIWRVPSLSAPDTDRLPAAGELTRYDAVRLFLDRARLRLPYFELTQENAPAVARVCGRLEGIPLAIELATARMGALAVEQVAGRLEDSLGLLRGGSRTAEPRQRTLRATLDWSHGLLSEQERKLFRNLSAFAGGFTLEAAESVASNGVAEADILDLLSKLVDKSLVIAEVSNDRRVRYRLLEPVRQYARQKLKESAETEAVLHRHASFFFALAEEAEPELKGAQQLAWLERLEREHDNLRAALSWALEGRETELASRLGAALAEFWTMRGHLNEGRRWLEAALAKGDARANVRVRVLAKASWLALEQDLERAIALGEEGLALARRLEDEEDEAATLLNLGVAVLLRGELERATVLLEEGLPLFRKLGDKWSLARALGCLGLVAMFWGDYERAKALMEESLTVSRESGDVWSSNMGLNQLAFVALLQEDYGRAQALCEEGLRLSRQSGMVHIIAFGLHTSAALAGSRGQPVRSSRLWGAAEALREAIGTAFSPMEQRVYEPYIAAARDQIEDAEWETAWSERRALSMEEAIDYVLSEGEEPADTPAPAQKRSSIPAQAVPWATRVCGL